jgi:hypothetical protein
MLRVKAKAGLIGLASAAAVLAAVFLLPAGPAAAGTAPPNSFEVVCANGGQGLCLTQGGQVGTLVINSTAEPSDNNLDQRWKFFKDGVTSSTGPFLKGSGLNTQVAAGRLYGEWEASGDNAPASQCLAFLSGKVTLNDCGAVGTEWVLSGSGRMISVLASNDGFDNGGIPVLEFLNSSGTNGQAPSVIVKGNTCPRSCWGPAAG